MTTKKTPGPSRRTRTKKTSVATRAKIAGLHKMICTCLDDAKGLDVVSVNLAGKSSIADFMVIASGRSQRHVGAIADQIARKLKAEGFGKVRVEGLPHCDWVLIDAGDVIAHIFRPEVREFYNLERLWSIDTPDEMQAV